MRSISTSRTGGSRLRHLAWVVLLGAISSVVPSVAGAQSSDSKQREAKLIEQQLDELDDRMSALAEDANEANEQLVAAKQVAAEAGAAANDARASYREALAKAKGEATRRYVQGPGSALSLGESLQTNSTRKVYLDLATGQNIDEVDLLNQAIEDQTRATARADRSRRVVLARQRSIQQSMENLERLAANQEALLKRTRADVVKLLAVEEQRRVDAEVAQAKRDAAARQAQAVRVLAQRRAAEQADAARAASAARRRQPSLRTIPTTKPLRRSDAADTTVPRRGQATQEPVPVGDETDAALLADAGAKSNLPPATGSDLAVQTALAQLGKAYVWGASGAQTFDCSGLMGFAWAKAGKRLPHSSRAQYSSTRRVSREELQPGDLLFFGRPIHHVAMYIGNGEMVEAPHRRARVRVRSAWRKDYVGAGRVL